LIAPQLSEILPNPASPKTDANDEYVELYNPNDKAFDLSGFILKAGTGSTYTYVFSSREAGLLPHEFKIFLLGRHQPFAFQIPAARYNFIAPMPNYSRRAIYNSDAQDGYGWILADGLWQWTSVSTPSARNIISTSTGADATLSGEHPALPSAAVVTKTYPFVQISELLPNPKTPETDADNEFIELYNPNKQAVDLTGYQIVNRQHG
jgi:hypothetical protein